MQGKQLQSELRADSLKAAKDLSAGPWIVSSLRTTVWCIWVYLGGLRSGRMHTVAENPSELGDAYSATSRVAAWHILHQHIKNFKFMRHQREAHSLAAGQTTNLTPKRPQGEE
jgi:hypothetical protein